MRQGVQFRESRVVCQLESEVGIRAVFPPQTHPCQLLFDLVAGAPSPEEVVLDAGGGPGGRCGCSRSHQLLICVRGYEFAKQWAAQLVLQRPSPWARRCSACREERPAGLEDGGRPGRLMPDFPVLLSANCKLVVLESAGPLSP